MELEEMQATWSEMNDQLEHQRKLTDKLIMEMTKDRYRNKMGRLSRYEGMGALICFAAAILLLFQFHKLNTWYFVVSGVFTIGYLIVLPILVLRSINAMRDIDLINNTYTETLIAYVEKRKQFLLTQRIGIYLNFILLAVSLPVLVKVFKGKDIFIADSNILYWYVPIMTIFLVFFSSWGYSKYRRITASASKILQELDDTKN